MECAGLVSSCSSKAEFGSTAALKFETHMRQLDRLSPLVYHKSTHFGSCRANSKIAGALYNGRGFESVAPLKSDAAILAQSFCKRPRVMTMARVYGSILAVYIHGDITRRQRNSLGFFAGSPPASSYTRPATLNASSGNVRFSSSGRHVSVPKKKKSHHQPGVSMWPRHIPGPHPLSH